MADMKRLFNEAISNVAPPSQFAEEMRKHNEADQEFYATQTRERQQRKAVSVTEAFREATNSPEAKAAEAALKKSYEAKPEQPKPKHSPAYEELMRKVQAMQENSGHSGNGGPSGPDGP